MKNKTAYMGVFLAFALVLSYVETLIPISFGIPGVKLGLTNLIVVMMLYQVGTAEAFTVSMLRIVLAGFMFGNMFSILYSLAGGCFSFLAMYLIKKTGWFHLTTVSICGGVAHNLGQLIVAALIVESYSIFYYAPVLLVAGIITGMLIGIIAGEVGKRLIYIIKRTEEK